MKTFQQRLSRRLAEAFATVLGEPAGSIDPAVRQATDAKFGDYQSNAAMGLARRAKLKPRELAEKAVAAAKLDDLTGPAEVAGPGFINLRLKDDVLSDALAEMAKPDERLAVELAERPDSVVVDFSSPNISKEMHIGHLRSTVLGDVLARVMEFAGHNVHRQNHIGDWGTQFGMLIAGLTLAGQQAALQLIAEGGLDNVMGRVSGRVIIRDFEAFYRQASAMMANPEFANLAREYVVGFQHGDEHSLQLLEEVRWQTLVHLGPLYNRLGISPLGVGSKMANNDGSPTEPDPKSPGRERIRSDSEKDGYVRGESAYNDDLPNVVADLKSAGLLRESEGAQCVFLDGFVNKDGSPLPFIVQKSDGGYLYATTDLAALRYRVKTFTPNRILYVVDSRQAHHFAYMFAVARAAGFAPAELQLVYVPFGTIQGADGKPFKTKSGESVKLADVLDEATQRARAVVEQKNPELPEAEKKAIAEAVGIGAIKYFDLSNNRVTDYRFDWDQMLALNGNTAPYLQYAYARVRSIFRKGGVSDAAGSLGGAAGRQVGIGHEKERALAVHLARYGEAIDAVLADYRPNILCDYLYELATRFSAFYEQCPVLKAEEPARSDRLMLSSLTAKVLGHGMEQLLGIRVIEEM